MMLNKYRFNTQKEFHKKLKESTPLLQSPVNRQRVEDEESDLIYMKENSPRKRALRKSKVPETEYEREMKKKFAQKQRELTIKSYIDN